LGVGRYCHLEDRRPARHHRDHPCVALSHHQDEHHQDHQDRRDAAQIHRDARHQDHRGCRVEAQSPPDERHQDQPYRPDAARNLPHPHDLAQRQGARFQVAEESGDPSRTVGVPRREAAELVDR
jgi:hypothetical protein